ncbi:ribonuclease HII [Pseudoflavonifractor sp. SW1122]|uniref:ribonuclease HII n=1 Tax=Pseudoflavonifractor sp. SW1122 TaxID=2530044 RepID=UPI00143BFA2A|nr:ribonuclease HII [Pseudoflavonifractor sp. SW1122]NJE74828.1 ribonuclease HII [Pseudoflavonifractor sp. SW1122]
MNNREKCIDLYQWDAQIRAQAGIEYLAGVDEAGAGPLAGRVYAAAVILPQGVELPYLNDSKKVTPRRRELLFDLIREQVVSYSVAWAEAEEIDQLDILNCRMLAMQRAIDGLEPAPQLVLVDGNRDHGSRCAITTPHELVVKGDAYSASIAAASILAKVSRDRYMEEMAQAYPQYAFDKHKGYPTKLHYELLREYGPCPIHRRSFLKKL